MPAVVVSNLIYVSGGAIADFTPSAVLEVFDPSQNTWATNAAPMALARILHAVAPYEGGFFSLGGHDGSGNYFTTNSFYNVAQNQWSELSPIPIARGRHGALRAGNRFYVVSGLTDGGAPTQLAHVYDPETDVWLSAVDVPAASSGTIGLGSINGRIYLAGGKDGAYTDATREGAIDGVDATPPAPPSSITVTNPGTGGQLDISWTNPGDADFDHIKLFRCPHTNDIGYLIQDELSTNAYADTGLTNGSNYFYTAIAVDSSGNWSTNRHQYMEAPSSTLDYGDAPWPYPTLSASNGASHVATGPRLGAERDAESDGVPSADADGDDTTGAPDDEDGVFGWTDVFVGNLDASVLVDVQNAPTGALLDAWIDFNADGSWGGAFEHIADTYAVTNGTNTVQFDVPSWAAVTHVMSRFRVSSGGDLGVGGAVADGEVEDYQVEIFSSAVGSGVFHSKRIISSSEDAAHGVFAADMDGDGDMDVLSSAFLGNTLAWHENAGNQSYVRHVISTNLSNPRYVFAADLDGDADTDVVCASWGNDTITWHENLGNGSFGQHTVFSGALSVWDVYCADVDSDGDIDVLSASYDADEISWYENDGNQAFTEHVISANANGPKSVFAADVDSDGDVDVLSASEVDDKVSWYENDGNQSFVEHVVNTNDNSAVCVFASDVDSNGAVDILSSWDAFGDRIFCHENNNQAFSEHTVDSSVNGPLRVYSADLQGDGMPDVYAASSGGVVWYEHDGMFGFTEHAVDSSGDGASAAFAADVDGDGDLDILSAGYNDDTIAWHEQLASPASLAIDALPAEYDTPTPQLYGTDNYESGTLITNTVTTPADATSTQRWVCTGWTGTGSVPASGASNSVTFTITNNSTLTWQWTNQWYLDVEVSGSGTVEVVDGWYTNGAVVSGIDATAASNYFFMGWSGDVPAGNTNDNPLSLSMNQARTVTAIFSDDSDGDGMPDWWESLHGLSNGLNDAAMDLDGDGLTNLGEYQNGTDPTATDMDGDGFSDYIELINSTVPTNGTSFPVYPYKEWTRMWGSTNGFDSADALSLLGTGSVCVVGSSNGDFEGGTNAGAYDIVLSVVADTGGLTWSRMAGSSASDLGKGCAVYDEAAILVGGDTQGSFAGQTNAGSRDLALIRFSTGGSSEWSRIWGGASENTANDVAADSAGNYYLLGNTTGGFDGQTNAGGRDVCLSLHDSNGTRLWSRVFGGASHDEGWGVADAPGGGIYSCGWTESAFHGQTNAGSSDAWLSRFDVAGDRLWTCLWGSPQDDLARGVAVGADGSIFVVGETLGEFDGQSSPAAHNCFLSKFDSDGNRLWSRIWGSGSTDMARSADVDGAGNVYVCGYTSGGVDGQSQHGSYDLLISKFDAAGNRLWSRVWGAGSSDQAYGIAVRPNSVVYVCGETQSDFDFEQSSGGSDMVVTKWIDEPGLTLAVEGYPSQHGSPSVLGYGTNYVNSGTPVTNTVATPADVTSTQRWVCTGWVGTGSVPASGTSNSVSFTITNNSTLTWQWTNEYVLAVTAGAGGSVNSGVVDGWYTDGITVTGITATAGAGYTFAGWSGDVPGGNTNDNPLSLAMDQARTLTANFDLVLYDVIVTNPRGAVVMGRADAFEERSITGTQPGAEYFAVHAADLDSNSVPEIIVGEQGTDRLAIWRQLDGTGTNWMESVLATNYRTPTWVSSADINDDGNLDLLSTAANPGEVTWWENLDGSWSNFVEHPVVGSHGNAVIAQADDVDGDGDLDIFETAEFTSYVAWLRNTDGAGTNFVGDLLPASGVTQIMFAVAHDLDQDGDPDAVISGKDTNSLFWSENATGDGSNWVIHVIDTNTQMGSRLFVADLDGDTDPDILQAKPGLGDLYWWQNLGGASNWVQRSIVSGLGNLNFPYAADMDGDNDLDILATVFEDDDVVWWENLAGNGTSWHLHYLDDDLDGPRTIIAHDLDGDGDLDPIVAALNADKVIWWENNACPIKVFDAPVWTNSVRASTNVTAYLTNTTVVVGTTQYVATGWTRTGSDPASGSGGDTGAFVLTNDTTITFNWGTNFWLDVETSGPGSVSVADGWHTNGVVADITATASNGFYFAGWSGDVPGGNTNDNPLALTMDQPRTVIAQFVERLA